MGKLSVAKGVWLALVGLACVVLLEVTVTPACAAESEGVVRTFILVEQVETIDFLNEDSVLVMAEHLHFNPAVIEFVAEDCEDDCLEYEPDASSTFNFDGTLWVTGRASHIMKREGCIELAPIAWLITEDTLGPPPTSAASCTPPR